MTKHACLLALQTNWQSLQAILYQQELQKMQQAAAEPEA